MARALLVDGDRLSAQEAGTTSFARALLASYSGAPVNRESFASYDAALIAAAGGPNEEGRCRRSSRPGGSISRR